MEVFQLFHFHTGMPILITPDGESREKVIIQDQEMDELSDSRVYLWRIHQSTKTILILMYVGVGG